MNLGISGTYSSGKTLTTMALSHYTGLPRTQALTMREILPDAVPGKTLAECTAAEFVQLVVRRHTERAVHERMLDGAFVSDGCSLQEWSYGTARVVHGIDPAVTADGGERPPSAETDFFAEVFVQLGHAFQRHVRDTYDAFVHLRHELPMRADGHRPMNDRFRTTCDGMILETLNRLGPPVHVVGGGIAERLWTIAGLLDLRPVMTAERAIELAEADYGRQDLRFERDRTRAAG
ncbi:AAA family ATPase [Actinomadura roseirufa]|uniref:AAA family ATPase n=1 Tax=Actinomadura roseirufa TaxID=2094049 RepID=UPI001040F65A|nr:AAA family ATPase [Actinomadura roseirufa]